MPIITKPTTILKGADGVFTLDKASLAALPSVSGNSYYSDMANWKRVIIFFKSNPGNQKTRVEFDATLSSPTGKFHTSSHAVNSFEVQYLMIEDFDGGTFPINRASLTATDFDVTLGFPPFIRDFVASPTRDVSKETTSAELGGTVTFTSQGLRMIAANASAPGYGLYYSRTIVNDLPLGIGNYKITLDMTVDVAFPSGVPADFRFGFGDGFQSIASGDARINTTGDKSIVLNYSNVNPGGNTGYGAGALMVFINGSYAQNFLIKSVKIEKL